MRALAALLAWLATTVALAVAVPAVWLQHNLVDAGGYAALTRRAAADPALREAAANELTTQAMRLIRARGYPGDVDDVHRAATAYAAGARFPDDFAAANRVVHDRLFTDADSWSIDVAPMLRDAAFQAALSDNDVQVPEHLMIPLGDSPPAALRPGRLHRLSLWGPWLSLAVAGLTVIFAALTVTAARHRGRALTALGVSALLVGAGGWAGIEIGRGRLADVLNRTTGDIRRIADAMVGCAEDLMHHWLNLTLGAGAALVILGTAVSLVGGVRRS